MYESYLNKLPIMKIENVGLRVIYGLFYLLAMIVINIAEGAMRLGESCLIPVLNVPLGLMNKRIVITHSQKGGLYYSTWNLASGIKPWDKYIAAQIKHKCILERPNLTLSQNF